MVWFLQLLGVAATVAVVDVVAGEVLLATPAGVVVGSSALSDLLQVSWLS